MELKIKPVFVLNKGENAFRHSDGTRDVVSDELEISRRLEQLIQESKEALKFGNSLLEHSIVRDEEELNQLKMESIQSDGLLLYCIGYASIQSVFSWGLPIVAFGGQHVPVAPLLVCGVERHSNQEITVAIDYQEIDEALTIICARKKLRASRILLFGFPPELFSRWHHLPDFELARRIFGVRFSSVELRELVALLPTIDSKKMNSIATIWEKEAVEVVEPQQIDLCETARMYLALKILLAREKANAFGINCLEMMRALKVYPPCYALTRLRDEGIHAACEADIVTLLTMMLLGYLSDAPAFMGNIVAAIPASNTISISHDVTPTKMAGFDTPAKPYILRNYHWSPGVTAHVELDIGQEVTLARLSRDLDKICLTSGKLVECRDTIACRTTISVNINDVRELVQRTFGYHLAVVYGNQVKLTSELCHKIGIQAVVV